MTRKGAAIVRVEVPEETARRLEEFVTANYPYWSKWRAVDAALIAWLDEQDRTKESDHATRG